MDRERQLDLKDVRDERVIAAMRRVPRARFVPGEEQSRAMGDHPLPIGYGQTISQPYIVAYMTEQLGVEPGDRVLEIGTGSGYQTAILAELGAEVFTVEHVRPLAEQAEQTLQDLGYARIHFRVGDGFAGWPEEAPFDRIVVTAAPESIPPALLDQLAPGGRMIIPVGGVGDMQRLVRVTKSLSGRVGQEPLLAVRFVPMVSP